MSNDNYSKYNINEELEQNDSIKENTMNINTVNLLKEYSSDLKILRLLNKNIEGVLDLSKFTQLENLCCEFNKITQIINIPLTLKKLYCSHNFIKFLDEICDGLELLSCSNNLIESLDNLPSTLRILDCNTNRITSLNELKRKSCEECKDGLILSINSCACSKLEILNCSYNQITFIDKLPPTLIELYCNNNLIISITKLPSKLKLLMCNDNKIESIDNQLPDSIIEVYLDSNNISYININYINGLIDKKLKIFSVKKNNFEKNSEINKFLSQIRKKIYCPFIEPSDFFGSIIDND